MICIYHDNYKVEKINDKSGQPLKFESAYTIAQTLYDFAQINPQATIVWCHSSIKQSLNISGIDTLFYHPKMMHSYGSQHYLKDEIGFIEDSPFINVKTDVSYPTWRMHTMVGAVYAEVLNAVNGHIPPDQDFAYFLNSVAKLLMPQGLFCYSSPQLLKSSLTLKNDSKSSTKTLFRFVKQHYKTQWIWFLFICFVMYKRQFPIWSLLYGLTYKRRLVFDNLLEDIPISSTQNPIENFTIDVVIPTIGRKTYLYDVLKDLASQTLLPQKVIIIEQNPDAVSKSELDYLYAASWPFKIKHIFTHQTGACNARNLGLKEVTSEFVFLADDDNRFEEGLLFDIKSCFSQLGADVITTSYIQPHESLNHNCIKQWSTFGAGNSFVKMEKLGDVRFNKCFEHGYGEDIDFGMQLRNKGLDIIYVPDPKIVHLKAPMGGFRTKFEHPWAQETLQPKPSPTVMLYHLKHQTHFQLLGYKTVLFFKFFRHQNNKNIVTYIIQMKKRWNNSIFWAKQLHSKTLLNQS